MTQYFVESVGAQPQLFVFAQTIECKGDDAESFETILRNFENNFNEDQQNTWIEYWKKQGEKIVLQEWKLKYKDYLAIETTNKAETTLTSKSNWEVEEQISNKAASTETTEESVEEYAESWEKLWQEHSEEIYSEQYILFTSLYYNFYLDFKKSILSKVEKDKEKKENTQFKKEYTTKDLATELKQLKLLGLPTTFGGREQYNSKRRSKVIETTAELYNIFFSDEDEEDDTDMNSDEIYITAEEEQDGAEKEQYAAEKEHNASEKQAAAEVEQYAAEKENDAAEVGKDTAEETQDAAEVEKDTAENEKDAAEETQIGVAEKRNDVEEEQNAVSEEQYAPSEIAYHKTIDKVIAKKTKNRKLLQVPTFLLQEKGMLKYWRKRFSLFSRYDDGIRLDRESWFSVTPEKIAVHLAERLSCDILIDGFCGCGGNTIQFARTCRKVIAIDIDPLKLEMAKHNAGIYGVKDKIDFVLGDFLQLSESGKLKGDIVFLSPPWGGPNYKRNQDYDIDKNLLPVGATILIEKSRNICENIALFLPRTSNMQQVIKLAGIGKRCEIEHNYLDSRLVAITALYGEGVVIKKQ